MKLHQIEERYGSIQRIIPTTIKTKENVIKRIVIVFNQVLGPDDARVFANQILADMGVRRPLLYGEACARVDHHSEVMVDISRKERV